MAALDPLGTALLLFLALTAAMAALYLGLRLLKTGTVQRALRAREEERTQTDRAHNALVTSEGIVRELRARGLDSVRADALLQEARQAHYEGRPREAEDLANEARSVLLEVLRKDEDPAPLPEPEEILGEPPEEKPVLGQEYPKNFLQAKFLLGVVQGRLTEAKKGSKRGRRIHALAAEAQTAFDEEQYTEALTLSLRCRRLMDGEEADVPPEPAPEESREEACPACGAPVGPEDEFCGKCGEALRTPTPRACPACDAEVGEEDNFCRQCGTELRAAPEAQ